MKDDILSRLVPETKGLLKIVTVPPDIADKHQGDSPFSEVHAMNVDSARWKASILRVLTRQLIGQRFMDWFYHEFEVKIMVGNGPGLLCSRRNLDESQSHHSVFRDFIYDQALSYGVEICHEHNHFSCLMPNKEIFLWWCCWGYDG